MKLSITTVIQLNISFTGTEYIILKLKFYIKPGHKEIPIKHKPQNLHLVQYK